MSQFAELFKAVKNDSKNPPEGNEKKPPAIINSRQITPKNEKGQTNKLEKAVVSETSASKKEIRVAQEAATTENSAPRLLQIPEESKLAVSPKKTGKSSDADYTQVLTYIRRDTHRQIKKVLIDDIKERDLSDLVEELLSGWLKKNA